MEILVIDSDPAARAVLLGRLQELKRGRELQAIEPIPLLPKGIAAKNFASVGAIILGPGLAQSASGVLEALAAKPKCPIAALFYPAPSGTVSVAVDNDDALRLFLIQSLAQSQLAKLAEARKVIGIAQFAGGVGATTLAIELGKQIAGAGNNTTVVDLDDVTSYLSVLAKAAPRYRAAVSDALMQGSVSDTTLSDLLAPFSERLTVVPQPESYAEAFHFKANVLENAPVSSAMVNSLLSSLRAKDHTVILDLAKSWGLATFAALPRCGQILFVISAESTDRVKTSIECLRRLKKESDAGDEFDTMKWSIVVTRADPAQASEIRKIINAAEMFPESVHVNFLPAPNTPDFNLEVARMCEQLG